jgi:UDP-N-acetylglucosamine--N-acetylmuramyl-(pentapeptide) pyrophosphoryl-undecaprenol N-acetylglucosamine transferase
MPYRLATPPRVLVLGGSQGARALNETVPEAIARTSLSVQVTHQCGATHARDVRARYAQLGAGQTANVVPFIDDMVAALAAADVVIGRSGASAVSEICAIGRPSLLVPYPHAAGDHQRVNAQALERDGAAVCLPASVLSPERIAQELRALLTDPARLVAMADAARDRGRPDAAADIARDLLCLASGRAEAAGQNDPAPSTTRPKGDLRSMQQTGGPGCV